MIVHCASNTPPSYPQKNCYKNNTNVDNKILSLIKKSNVKVFIYLSSISVYGKNKPKLFLKILDRNLQIYMAVKT